MIHICERYFSNTEEVEITDRLCEAVLKTIIFEAPRIIEDPNNYEARANIMWAGMLAHNNVCGVGRVQDWASHHIEHELSAMYEMCIRDSKLPGNRRLSVCKYLPSEYDRKESAGHGLSAWRRKCVRDSRCV